ncbi:MAG TPA: 1-deoxy-D-xylulose-5-phosphate reductoisomerase [Nitrospiria bacterium]|nr:1-deoxy-D-xylulose-5-phosphate reductoisomerase [Nitrospiria bacterium]
MKRLIILGSTGSIGTNALDLVACFPERFQVVGLTARKDADRLEAQIRKFRPRVVSLLEEEAAQKLRDRCRDLPVEVLSGIEGQNRVATLPEGELVVSAIVGGAGLLPTLSAIRSGKPVALANKETLVMAGQIICEEARRQGVRILPVDSEHSAVFQVLEGQRRSHVRRIILTASGGPLLDLKPDQRRGIKPAQALQHPTWRMGAKISIDSATLMNKGLEVIEARWLFDLLPDRIDVVIHRQSILHSMVEFVDGSVIAQLGIPDMRIPLSYAMNYPERLPLSLPTLDLSKAGPLTFEQPDPGQFPCLAYAYEALKAGGTMPAVLNAANEEAVTAYLKEQIGFTDITKVIRATMDAHQSRLGISLEDILEADRWAREHARRVAETVTH